MPERSIPKDAAYQIINDELMLDGNPWLNLASFVTTWMEPECDRLMMATVNKNYVDIDEYPITTVLQGYKNIMENCMENSRVPREGLEETGRFEIISKDIGVPLIAFSLKDRSRHIVFEIAESMRKFGWIIPAYTMPVDVEHVAVLWVVIREDFSRSLAECLVLDIKKVLAEIELLPSRTTTTTHVTDAKIVNGDHVINKSDLERQREITTFWRNLVKTSRIC